MILSCSTYPLPRPVVHSFVEGRAPPQRDGPHKTAAASLMSTVSPVRATHRSCTHVSYHRLGSLLAQHISPDLPSLGGDNSSSEESRATRISLSSAVAAAGGGSGD